MQSSHFRMNLSLTPLTKFLDPPMIIVEDHERNSIAVGELACIQINTYIKQDWKFVFIKPHICIDPMSKLISHHAVPPHFTTKLHPCLLEPIIDR